MILRRPTANESLIKILDKLSALPDDEFIALVDAQPSDPNGIGAQIVEAQDFMRNFMETQMIDDDKLRQEAKATFLKSYTPDGKCNDEVEEMECARFVQGYLAHAAKAEGLAKELQYVVDQLVDRATWLQHRMEMD